MRFAALHGKQMRMSTTQVFPELALGTVQFGVAYGVAGAAARIGDATAASILEAAARRGVRMIDTAPMYGEIEQRLDKLESDGGERRCHGTEVKRPRTNAQQPVAGNAPAFGFRNERQPTELCQTLDNPAS